ncbi:apolipoprotein N-acyltransferase [Paludisphaera rhizosphaerae]|uniref:apolipoprotein N-acyltransferase n=1 Tax=Paludisphaera rhizosphaerae TaxID=2711216 RepID=UPI0013EB127D|nr:apolipoprotein N-acyltransferase [Paludisphaera rhizosphaerae]
MEPGTAVTESRESDGRLSLSERVSRHPIAAGIISGLALWAAFPPMEFSALAWVALVPLFRLAVEPGARWRVYLGAWAGGLVFWGASLQWIRLTDPSAWTAWVVMAAILSVWWPAFLGLTRYAVFGLKIPLLVAAPIFWVGLEHSRIYILSGFPWYYLAHSQYQAIPVIQIADITGALGVSFLIATVNALLVDLLRLPLFYRSEGRSRLRPKQRLRLAIVGLGILGTLIYGAYRLSRPEFLDGPRLAMIQTNFEQHYKSGADWQGILNKVESLVIKAAGYDPKPDLIVWPETSYPWGTISIDPATPSDVFAGHMRQISDGLTPDQWRENERESGKYLHGFTDALKIPMMIGGLRYEHRPEGLRKYNAAVLLTPGSPAVQVYRKIQLVPFGEYIPLIDLLPWLTVFTPYRDGYLPTLTFGREANSLDLGPYKVAVGICFEDTVPHLIRRFFNETPDGRQPDVLIDMSNDGWFRGSAELDMHLAVSVFRCIENRVPLARAVNTGLSALIDGDGRILQVLSRDTEGVLQVRAPLDPRTSLYSMWGDWLGLSCLAVCIGIWPTGMIYKRLRSSLIGRP